MPQVPKYETLAHPQARASLHAASSAQTVNYGQPKTASMTLKDFSQGEYLTASEAIQHKLFLSMLLNMVNDEKAKRSPAKDRHFGPRQTKPSIEKQPIAIIERNQKVIVKAPGPAIDSRSQSSDVGGMILKLETTLNDLERHNASLVRENIGLKQKLRGVEDLYGLKEDETAEVVTKAKTLLDSAQSPFFRANTSVRAFTSQKAKGGLQGQQYGDHVRDKIEANEKIRTMKAEIGQLQEENTLLKHKNQTYETEINELYQRIDKFGSLESSVA